MVGAFYTCVFFLFFYVIVLLFFLRFSSAFVLLGRDIGCDFPRRGIKMSRKGESMGGYEGAEVVTAVD